MITVSAGNHAQGVAYHAAKLGIRAVIVMPIDTPYVKVENTRRLGAEVVLIGESFAEARAEMHMLAQRDRLVIVHPYDDPWVIAGQGTLGLEMMAQIPRDRHPGRADWRWRPDLRDCAGGPSHCTPRLKLSGCRPPIFQPCMICTTDQKRQPEPLLRRAPGQPHAPTIAEGIAVDQPGELTAPIVLEHVNRIDLVSEAQLEQAIIYLLEIEKTVAEGAGAAGLAAVMARPGLFKGRRSVWFCVAAISTR